jgi:hypothetical protein
VGTTATGLGFTHSYYAGKASYYSAKAGNTDEAIDWGTQSGFSFGLSLYGGVQTAKQVPSILSIKAQDTRIIWLDEAPTKFGYAQEYEDGAIGARSNVTTGQRQVPALQRRLPNGSTEKVKFDGSEENILIDRKVAITTFPKSKIQALRQSEAIQQNDLTGRWEIPTDAEANRANKFLLNLGINNISVKVAK